MMHIRNSQSLARPLVAAALALLVAMSIARPVYADGAASTRNIILGAAAAVAGVILYNNIHHKQVAHNTIVGYTQDGGTVYADGRIVYPNGTVVYTANGNGQRCSYDGSQAYCPSNPTVYNPNGYNGYSGYNGYQNTQYNGYKGYQNAQYGDQDSQTDRDDRYQNNRRYNGRSNTNGQNNYHNTGQNGNRGNRPGNSQWYNGRVYSQTRDR